MPIRARKPDDMPGCVTLMRTVHEVSGYPSVWPVDAAGWLTPADLVAAWPKPAGWSPVTSPWSTARGRSACCKPPAWTQASSAASPGFSSIPAVRRQGLARALLEVATAQASDHGLQPVLNVMADGHAEIAWYERSGWKLAGSQPATWTTPDGISPMMRYYVGPF